MAANYISILSIDPGINHCGWADIRYTPSTDITEVCHFGLIEATDLAKKEFKVDFKEYSRVISLDVYRREFKLIMEKYLPDYVVSEGAFYNPHRPNAFLSLSLCLHTLQSLLYHEFRMPLYTIAPRAIKHVIWGNGNANKEAVQEGIKRHPDLVLKEHKSHPIEKMVEHEADSIAAGYAFVKTILPDLLMRRSK